MEVLTFFVVYYHVFFICSAVVIGLDYILETDVFNDLRALLDKPVCSLFIFIEICIGAAFVAGYVMNSTLIMSTLWVMSVILAVSVLFSIVVFALHKLLGLEW